MAHNFLSAPLALAAREIGVVVAIGVVALGVAGFGLISDEMMEGEWGGFDRAVLLLLREHGDLSDPVGPVWVERGIADLTSLGGYAVLTVLVLGAVGYLLVVGKRGLALLLAGAVASGAVLSEGLKLVFGRARPDLVPHLATVESASFPSGHAMLSAITYLTLAVLLARAHRDRRVKALVLTYGVFLTVVVGLSRMYLGVHWPTDVLAGWAVGGAWAALWWLLARWFQTRGLITGGGDAT